MTETAEQKLNEDMTVAAEMLSQMFGTRVQLGVGDDNGLGERSYVHRLNVAEGSSSLPQTIILKQAAVRGANELYDPDALDGPAVRLFNEWAGLQFLGEVCSQPLPAPRFYGGNRERGFILMEDFGPGSRLDHALLGTDAVAAEKTLLALFQTLGRMHAQTSGKEARYNGIRSALGPTQNATTILGPLDQWNIDKIRQGLDAFGYTPQKVFYQELEAAWKMVKRPEPFYAYVHADPCPDNCHWVKDDLRLLDFERGQYFHALLDGSYFSIPFPTCWCANQLPAEITQKAEAIYRAELAKGCPAAQDDDLFYSALAAVSTYRIFSFFSYAILEGGWLEQDFQWGISSGRQRLLMWFDNLATTGAKQGIFPAISNTARALINRLQDRYPNLEAMPYYPAFHNQ